MVSRQEAAEVEGRKVERNHVQEGLMFQYEKFRFHLEVSRVLTGSGV